MTKDQKRHFESLRTVRERAEFLLGIGVSAKLDAVIDDQSVYRAHVGNLVLPITATTEITTVKKATNWLMERTRY